MLHIFTLLAISLLIVTVAADGNDTAHDFFVSSDNSLALTLNVANDSNDFFFSFFGPKSSSWISFGLGSDKMQSALMFLVYASSSGNNITLSPRLPVKHAEPSYSSAIQVEVLDGSGIYNDTLIANFRCSNCRDGYNINITSTSQKMCFASGPNADLKSDNLNVALMRHSSYGSFLMNMQQATGPGGLVTASTGISDSGSSQTSFVKDHDFSVEAHAAIMIITFMVIMPLGVYLLRGLGKVKWHAINQGVAALLTVVGTALGMNLSTQYNRSKNFATGHQLMGIVIFVAVLAQFTLGYMHHRIYKKTLSTTRLGPIHVWLGRCIIPVAVIDAFLGFPLALSTGSDYWFAGVVIVYCLTLGAWFIWRLNRKKRDAGKSDTRQNEIPPSGPRFGNSSVELHRIAPPLALHGGTT